MRLICSLQSLLVSILAGAGVLNSTEDQKNLANFLICLEMLPAAVGMLFAFPYHEYKGTGKPTASAQSIITATRGGWRRGLQNRGDSRKEKRACGRAQRSGHGIHRKTMCAEPSSGRAGLGNVRHVISIHDVVSDTMHQFAPSYHDYVLYSNGGNKEAPKKARRSSRS